MRKNKWLLPKIMICVAFIAINISCDKEPYDEAITISKQAGIREVKFDELLKENKFKNLLTALNNNQLQRSASARSAFENQHSFTISNSVVKVIETDSLTSYTMLIERDGNTNQTTFANLVIQEDIYNVQRAAIYKYTPTDITSTEHNSFLFRGHIQKKEITNFSGFNRVYEQTTNSDDCYGYVSMCNYGGSEHPAGANCTRTYVVRVKVICAGPSTGGGNGNDDDFWDGNSGGNNDGLGYPYGYAGGGGGPSDTQLTPLEQLHNIDDVVTSPIKGAFLNAPAKTPCTDLYLKSTNLDFKQKMQELAIDANGVAEAGNVTYNDAPKYGNKKYGGLDSNGNSMVALEWDNTRASQTTGFMHCHLNSTNPALKTLTVFSLTDFVAYATLVQNSSVDVTELGIYVTTDRGTFALKLTDKQAIINLSNYIKNDPNGSVFKDFEKKVKFNESKNKQIKGLLNFFNQSGSGTGIELYERDDNNQDWKKKSLNINGNVQTTDC